MVTINNNQRGAIFNILVPSCGGKEEALKFFERGEHKEYRAYTSIKDMSVEDVEEVLKGDYEVSEG